MCSVQFTIPKAVSPHLLVSAHMTRLARDHQDSAGVHIPIPSKIMLSAHHNVLNLRIEA
jgi:hypothetical protein